MTTTPDSSLPNPLGPDPHRVNSPRIAFWIREEPPEIVLGLRPESAETIPGGWLALELLPAGTLLAPGEGFGFLITDRGTHDLRAPEPMRIVGVNAQAAANPNLVKLSPTGLGWLVRAVRTSAAKA